MAAKLISPKALKQAVLSNAVVLVFADWCMPCQTMKPIFVEVAEELKQGEGGASAAAPDVSHVHFCKLDYDKHGHDISAAKIGQGDPFTEGFHEIVKEYPTVVFFRRGRAPTLYTDGADAATLAAAIRAHYA